jgi:predicted MFS family arabinose efflux permease
MNAGTRAVVLLAGVLGLNSADAGAIGALANQLEQDLHIGHMQLGLLAAASSAVGAATTVPVGVLADRSPRVRLLAIAVGAWAVAMAGGALAPSYLWLLVSRLALGGAVAAANPVTTSLIGDLFPRARRARVLGWILTGEVIGAGAGLLIAGNIGAVLSWRYAFLVLAVVSAVLAFGLCRLLPEPARGGAEPARPDEEPARGVEPTRGPESEPARGAGPARGREPEPAGGRAERAALIPAADQVQRDDPRSYTLWHATVYLLGIPTVRLLIVASSVGYFFFAGLRTFAVVFIERRFGVTPPVLSGLVVLIGVVALAGLVAGGRATDALLNRGQATARVTVPAVAYAAAAIFFVPGLVSTAVPLALATSAVAAAALSAANPGLDAARLDIVPGALWGRAEGLRTVLRLSGEAAAPVIFGIIADQLGAGAGAATPGAGPGSAVGLRDAFLVMTVPLLANGVLMWLTRRTYPSDVAAAIAIDRQVLAADRGG